MPIQLKKEKMKPWNTRFRISAVAMLAITLAFTIVFGIYVEKIMAGTKFPVIFTFCLFCMYFISVVLSSVLGIMAYIKEDNIYTLVQGIILIAPVIFCLMNTKTAAIMMLAVFNKDKTVVKLLGNNTYFQYVSLQYSRWICLMIGLVIAMIIGVLAIVTFIKNKK